MTPTSRPVRATWLPPALLVILVLALGRLWWLPAHASLNVNEGWNAGQVARAFGAGTLYPAPDALVANNYPPLSFLIVGLVGRVVGDTIVAGRLVSLVAEAAVGWAVCVVVSRLAPDPRWRTAGALFFAGFAVTLLRRYLLMNDPQWLAQAAMAWTLVLLTPRRAGETPSARAVVAAAALAVAGGLVKHNLVAVPAAATLWLWIADRRAFRIWVGAGLVLLAVACAVLLTTWGTAVFTGVLAPARSYSVLRMAAHGGPLLLAILPGLLACRPLLGAWREDRRLLLPVLLLAVAIPTAVIQRSGDGVDINATFETILALAIAVPVACALRPRAGGRWFWVAMLPVIALVPVAAIADARELAGRDAAVRRWEGFTTRIAAARGPVACDDQAMCHWAGRRSAMDFFALKQRLLKGDVPALRAALDRRAFAMIAMRSKNPGWHENRLIPAIRARYRTVYADGDYELLVPR